MDRQVLEEINLPPTRWSVEVFFKETKQHLGLGKCQAQDFDAQIAATTHCMLQYNLLSVELIAELSEIFNIETEMLMEKLFSENEKLTKYLNFKNLPQAG